jgi:MHS family proline/betaine transporter-like MFS transporter
MNVSDTKPAPSIAAARRAVSVAVVGNVLEWYDFAVYGFLAAAIGRNFFPTGDETSQLLAAFAVFGSGFLARPLGGIVIGRLGDVKGRRTALLLTIFLMAAGTVMMGLVPTFAAIGVAAPLLILVARLMQGFSAGGEWGGSTAFIVEWAPEGKRGFYGSFQQCSVAAGVLLGSGITAVDAWGWRVPFLLGGLLGPVGIYMRRSIDETPAYTKEQTAPQPAPTQDAKPLVLAGRAFGFTVLWTVVYYIFLSYMPTFTARYASLSSAQALWSNTVGLVVLVVAIPAMGLLSDRVGRRPLLLGCCAAFLVLPYPVAKLMVEGPPFGAIIAMQVLLGVIISLFSGAGPAAIAEIFPTRSRSTWMTTGYALAVTIFGGFAPYIAVWLISQTGSPVAWVYYVMAAALVSGIVIYGLRETAHEPLR